MKVAETSPRVGLVLKADLRAGHDTGQLAGKVERLADRLERGDEPTPRGRMVSRQPAEDETSGDER